MSAISLLEAHSGLSGPMICVVSGAVLPNLNGVLWHLTSGLPLGKVTPRTPQRGAFVRAYEIVYAIRPDLSDEERAGKVERIHSLISENGGEIEETNDWGKRKLAYEINHYSEGYYGLTTFTLPPTAVQLVKGRLDIDEGLLRYQIVSKTN